MKKIGIIAQFGKFGGTRTYMRMLLEYYYSQRHNVIVFQDKSHLTNDVSDLIRKYRFTNIIIPSKKYLFQKFPFNIYFDIVKLFPIIKTEKLDILVISDGPLINFIGLIIVCKNILYVVHTYPLEKLAIVYRCIVRYSIKFKNMNILTVSKYSKKMILNYCLDGKFDRAIKVIYHTIINTSSKRSYYNRYTDKKIVLTLGHVEQYKNPFVWITVAKNIVLKKPNTQFIWVGNGALLKKCREMIPQKYKKNIKFIGYRKEVGMFYSKAYIYFQPSIIESLGISVIEAMKFGLPSVVSNAGGLPECVENKKNGYTVDPFNEIEMENKIIKLLSNKKIYTTMSMKTIKNYQKIFSRKEWSIQMNNLHKSILKNTS